MGVLISFPIINLMNDSAQLIKSCVVYMRLAPTLSINIMNDSAQFC